MVSTSVQRAATNNNEQQRAQATTHWPDEHNDQHVHVTARPTRQAAVPDWMDRMSSTCRGPSCCCVMRMGLLTFLPPMGCCSSSPNLLEPQPHSLQSWAVGSKGRPTPSVLRPPARWNHWWYNACMQGVYGVREGAAQPASQGPTTRQQHTKGLEGWRQTGVSLLATRTCQFGPVHQLWISAHSGARDHSDGRDV